MPDLTLCATLTRKADDYRRMARSRNPIGDCQRCQEQQWRHQERSQAAQDRFEKPAHNAAKPSCVRTFHSRNLLAHPQPWRWDGACSRFHPLQRAVPWRVACGWLHGSPNRATTYSIQASSLPLRAIEASITVPQKFGYCVAPRHDAIMARADHVYAVAPAPCAAPAQPDQGHVATASGDQGGEIGVGLVPAVPGTSAGRARSRTPTSSVASADRPRPSSRAPSV